MTTQRTEQSSLIFLQYFWVLLSDLDAHFCQSEIFKMKFCTDLNSANRKLADSLSFKDHKFLTVNKLTGWLQQQRIFWEIKQRLHSQCDNDWESHMTISSAQSEWASSETQHKINEKKAPAMRKNSKMLDEQNFLICGTAERRTMDPPGMNPERARRLGMSNRTAPRRKFMSEEEKKAQRQAE